MANPAQGGVPPRLGGAESGRSYWSKNGNVREDREEGLTQRRNAAENPESQNPFVFFVLFVVSFSLCVPLALRGSSCLVSLWFSLLLNPKSAMGAPSGGGRKGQRKRQKKHLTHYRRLWQFAGVTFTEQGAQALSKLRKNKSLGIYLLGREAFERPSLFRHRRHTLLLWYGVGRYPRGVNGCKKVIFTSPQRRTYPFSVPT